MIRAMSVVMNMTDRRRPPFGGNAVSTPPVASDSPAPKTDMGPITKDIA
jgi:hypothetical protein